MTLREKLAAKAAAPANPPMPPAPETPPAGAVGQGETGHPERRLEAAFGLPSAICSPALQAALVSKSSRLCLWLEPVPSTSGWIAVQAEEAPHHPLLLVRLPLTNAAGRDQPF